MPTIFNHYPDRPTCAVCETSYLILCNSHDTASSFLETFNQLRVSRNAKGIPTDEEQDLLRAMLIFACSGLDSMVKQLTLDALPEVIDKDLGANDMFKTYVERRIKKDESFDSHLLAEVLCDDKPRIKLINILINDITSQSLQSREQLFRVGAYFNIPSTDLSNDLSKKPPLLDQIFLARNQIAHEMDIDFSQANRSRRPRKKQTMVDYTNEILRIGESFLSIVNGKISN